MELQKKGGGGNLYYNSLFEALLAETNSVPSWHNQDQSALTKSVWNLYLEDVPEFKQLKQDLESVYKRYQMCQEKQSPELPL